MDAWISEQQARNEGTAATWTAFAEHRQHVMRHLLEAGRNDRGRLCVLGAGNCNDLDLPVLLEHYDEVHLVDLDGKALSDAVARQGVTDHRLFLHGNFDLTGAAGLLQKGEAAPDDAVKRVAESSIAELPGPFDAVASVGVLSQLIDWIVWSLGPETPRVVELVLAVRMRHLRLLTDLLASGGRGLLISDFVSSQTAEELPTVPADKFSAYCDSLLQAHNHYAGLHPQVVEAWLKTDPAIAPHLSRVQLLPPWRWKLGKRTLGVFAIGFRKLREA